jgi:hypothetical protein
MWCGHHQVVRKECSASLICRLSASDATEREEQNQRDSTKPIFFSLGLYQLADIVAYQTFYADKTRAIMDLESLSFFCKIWRPRSSGKSLFCRQLALYYDIAVDEDNVSLLTSAYTSITLTIQSTLFAFLFFLVTTQSSTNCSDTPSSVRIGRKSGENIIFYFSVSMKLPLLVMWNGTFATMSST